MQRSRAQSFYGMFSISPLWCIYCDNLRPDLFDMSSQRWNIDDTVLLLKRALLGERHLSDGSRGGRGRGQERHEDKKCDGKLDLHSVTTEGQRAAAENQRGDNLYMRWKRRCEENHRLNRNNCRAVHLTKKIELIRPNGTILRTGCS